MFFDRKLEETAIYQIIGYECEGRGRELANLIGKNSGIFYHERFEEMYKLYLSIVANKKITFESISSQFAHSIYFKNFADYSIETSNLEAMGQYRHYSASNVYSMLRHLQLRRQYVAKLDNNRIKAMDLSEDTFEIIWSMQKDMQDMLTQLDDAKFANKEVQLSKVESYIQRKRAKPNRIDGVACYYESVDDIIGGFRGGNLIIIAARPSMGKTAFALDMARNMAKNFHVDFYSIEMTSDELYLRLLSQDTGIPSRVISDGTYDDKTAMIIDKGLEKLRGLPLIIDDFPSISVRHIKNQLLKKLPQERPKAIFIDYLGLMTMEKGSYSRERDVAETTKELKALAKEVDVPIFLLSQLNRELEKRTDPRPILSDLRESGSIEQDADVVIFIHRDEQAKIFFDKKGKPTAGQAEIIIDKNRNGATGKAYVGFNKECTHFYEFFREEEDRF